MNPKRIFSWKATGTRQFLVSLISVALIFSFCGCDDSVFEDVSADDTYESRIEEAKMALDDSDFSRAADILEALEAEYPNNDEVKQYLSNAYSGLAGLDTYDLLETIDTLDEAGQSGSIDMISTVLGDDDGRLSEAQITKKLGYLNDAIASMDQTITASIQSDFSTMNLSEDDRIVQRGLLALSRIVLLLGDMIIDQLSITEVVLTEAGIRVHYADQEPDFDDIFNDVIEQTMAEDIQAIEDAIEAIKDMTGTDNDLHEDFETFMNDLDVDGNRIIDQAEIESYLLSIING